jgi:hypothetical protein
MIPKRAAGLAALLAARALRRATPDQSWNRPRAGPRRALDQLGASPGPALGQPWTSPGRAVGSHGSAMDQPWPWPTARARTNFRVQGEVGHGPRQEHGVKGLVRGPGSRARVQGQGKEMRSRAWDRAQGQGKRACCQGKGQRKGPGILARTKG